MKNLRSVRGICKTGKRPFMRLFTSDYRDGTAQLSFELQGFYFRILTYLHDGERVPADAAELARFLQCSPRTTRAFVPKLITAGKLYEANGELRNKRVDRDLEPMSASDETELEPTSNPIEPEVEPNSGRESQIIESNQSPQNHTMEITTSISNSISIPEEEPEPASVEQEPDGLAGLNGAAASMIASVQGWMVGGDERCARNWLATTTRVYGPGPTKAAYHKLVTDMADGQTFAKPLQVWSRIAQRMAEAVEQPKPDQASAYQRARAEILAGGVA